MSGILLSERAFADENERAVHDLAARMQEALANDPVDLTAFIGKRLRAGATTPIWAVRLATKDGRSLARSGWIASHIDYITGGFGDQATRVHALRDGLWTELSQLSLVDNEVVLVAHGLMAQLVVHTATLALETFDSSRFDEDGYLLPDRGVL